MPSLINTDNAGNTFYNYITPVIRGESGLAYEAMTDATVSLLRQAWGGTDYAYKIDSVRIGFRPLALGLEGKIGSCGTSANRRFEIYIQGGGQSARIYSGVNSSDSNFVSVAGSYTVNASDSCFMVVNDYAFACATLTTSNTVRSFFYAGYLREPSYDSVAVGPMGAIILGTYMGYLRPLGVTSTSNASFASAADAITSPPIVCTAGTDPGDGSETFTDIVIRDAAAPNNPVGKLWNCIDMPATCNVGELWRNTGAHDGDASASEQDTYLCVMPWGTRKLGMRVWTENVV